MRYWISLLCAVNQEYIGVKGTNSWNDLRIMCLSAYEAMSGLTDQAAFLRLK